ncbi:LysE family translocator [Planomonospora sp. ID67723]|uniref:LysE family translocator n=1 Tax=Planomonospora sp. ID67723 TaxID=2738134 RepID=UPI0018C419C5|nr:LysE family translocator [Planomonospora sp. ID67723]MBG0831780.1 LysE family translocator [Planomonospora sp. ID67723]
MLLVAFVGSCFLLAMIPGVSTAVILRQTLCAGRGPGMAATLGNETGILLWALAAAFGLSALVLASEVAYEVMRILGAGFLVVMGVQSIRRARGGRAAQAGPEKERPGPVTEGWRRSYLLGFSTCLANPKAAVFAMSFLPQFVPEGADVPLTLALLAVVWVLVDTVWYGLFIWTVGRARMVFGRPAVRYRLEQVSGAVLIGLGVRLAVEAR